MHVAAFLLVRCSNPHSRGPGDRFIYKQGEGKVQGCRLSRRESKLRKYKKTKPAAAENQQNIRIHIYMKPENQCTHTIPLKLWDSASKLDDA